MIEVSDPEKDTSGQDLESREAPSDLVQALLLLEAMSVTPANVIDLALLALNGEGEDLYIYISSRHQVEAGGSHKANDSHNLESVRESNAGSSW